VIVPAARCASPQIVNTSPTPTALHTAVFWLHSLWPARAPATPPARRADQGQGSAIYSGGAETPRSEYGRRPSHPRAHRRVTEHADLGDTPPLVTLTMLGLEGSRVRSRSAHVSYVHPTLPPPRTCAESDDNESNHERVMGPPDMNATTHGHQLALTSSASRASKPWAHIVPFVPVTTRTSCSSSSAGAG